VGEGSGMGAAGFCGPCMCLGVFLLLWWRVFLSRIEGARGVYGCYSRLVSGWWVCKREGSVVTVWGRTGGGGKDRVRVDGGSRKSSWEGE
jgi:hypothetical protein